MSKILYIVYRSLTVFKHTLLVSAFGYSSYCNHSPKCSEYMLQCVQKDKVNGEARKGAPGYATISGLWKGFKRLLTCW